MFTKDDGCIKLSNITAGTILAPTKDDDFIDGVNIGDVIYLQKYILGLIDLNPYQLIAADLNFDKIISYKDIILLSKYLNLSKKFDSPVWVFADASDNLNTDNFYTYNNSIEYSDLRFDYSFIGIKMGDIDNSWEIEKEIDDIIIKDNKMIGIKKYNIPFILNRDVLLEGFNLRVKYNPDKMIVNNVKSLTLPGFSWSKNVSIENNEIIISYNASNFSLLNGGNKLKKGDELLVLEATVTDVCVLNENLSLSEEISSNIFTKDKTYNLVIEWQDAVATDEIKVNSDNTIVLSPMPAKDFVDIKINNTDNRNIKYSIFNIIGKELINSELNTNKIDISTLKSGLYLVSFYNSDKLIGVKKLIVE
jgi:hypothetical protein